VGFRCRHRNLALTGAALLWGLALGSLSASAQQTTAPYANTPKVSAENEQCSQGHGGDQPNTSPKSSPDGQSDEKSKKEATPPAYKLLRYDEDYSYLKDPSRRTDFWDPIKYIALCGRDDWYLSIGGELRERYEFYHEQDAGQVPPDARNNGYLLERYLLHGDLHLGPYFRFFGQFMTGLEDGRIGGPRPDIDRDAFDVHQAFADFVLPLAGDKDTLTARLGRQEFEYGSGRLIDVRDGPNLRLSFDAARLLLHTGDWEVDGWWAKPVRDRPGVFDDDPDPTRSFWGLYAVHPLPLLPKGNIDLYYLGFENKDAVYAQGPGYELRHTVGTRLWGRRSRGSTISNTIGSSAPSDRATSRRGAPPTPSATTSANCRSNRASACASTSPAVTITRPRRTSRPSTRYSPRAFTSTSLTPWGRST
jgi:hypothetical protein